MTYSINMRRGVLIAILALAAIFAVNAPARAAVTAGPNSGLGVPSFVQDANGQQAELCFAPGPCGAGAPTQADFADTTQDQEAFYWRADTTVSLPEGDLALFFTLEGTNAPLAFQRAQLDGDKNMPNGTYTVTTPWGVFNLNKTAAGSVDRWRDRFIDGSDPVVGPLDNFLTSASAPAGFYGDAATEGPVVGNATISVVGPDDDNNALTPNPNVGSQTNWIITGKKAGPPAPVFLASPLNLGAEDIGQVHSENVTISNGGSAPLSINSASVSGAGFALVSNGCTAALAPGENCNVRVSATASKAGAFTGSLTVTDNTAAGTHSVSLTASGNPAQTPPASPVVIDNTRPNTVTTITQIVPAPTIGSATVVTRQAFNGRVTALTLRNGVANMRTPRGADVVRLTVRKGGKFVKRITRTVNDNGQRLRVVLTRKPGRYSVEVRAGNEQNDVTTFGPTVRRSFRVV